MTATQSLTIARIDRDRAQLHAATRQRLTKALRPALAAAKRSADPAQCQIDTSVIQRLAMLAYLRGMYRTVKDASKAFNRDVRVSHLLLSREEEKKERDALLWLIAFLGLTPAAVEAIRQRAGNVAARAADEIGSAIGKRVQASLIQSSNERNTRESAGGLLPQRDGEQRSGSAVGRSVPRSVQGAVVSDERRRSGGVSEVLPIRPGAARFDSGRDRDGVRGRSDGVGRVSPDQDSVFGTFGRADVESPVLKRAVDTAFRHANVEALTDTWAEAVAYSQYEAGRWDAVDNYPAVSEMLWGFRWMSTLDNRTSNTCRTLDGWAAPLGDTFMEALRPPVHFHCRSLLTPIYRSSRLKIPVEVNRPSDATLNRYLAQKEEFVRRLA